MSEEVQELKNITADNSDETVGKFEQIKKRFNRLRKLFGFSIIAAIVFGGILTNYSLNLKNQQEQLTKQIESLSKTQVSSEQIKTLENQINSLTKETKTLSQQVETLRDSIPQNSNGN